MSAEAHIEQTPEPPSVHLRGVLWAAGGALVLLVVTIILFSAIYKNAVPVKAPPEPQVFSAPRVDTGEAAERRSLTAEQTKALETWRWANDQHTLVQIPIERAMQLLVGKGADAYAPLIPPQPALVSPTAAAQRAVTPEEHSAAPQSKNSLAPSGKPR